MTPHWGNSHARRGCIGSTALLPFLVSLWVWKVVLQPLTAVPSWQWETKCFMLLLHKQRLHMKTLCRWNTSRKFWKSLLFQTLNCSWERYVKTVEMMWRKEARQLLTDIDRLLFCHTQRSFPSSGWPKEDRKEAFVLLYLNGCIIFLVFKVNNE